MDGAGRIGTYLTDRAHVAAFGDDGLGGKLAHFELRTLRVVFRPGFVVSNRGVLVPWNYSAALLLPALGRADVDQLGFRRDGLRDVNRDFG